MNKYGFPITNSNSDIDITGMYYKLMQDGSVIEATSLEDYFEWKNQFNDLVRVNKTTLFGITISTVFLGLNHNYLREGKPHVFETMVFGGIEDGYQERYSTLEDAKAGHWDTVRQVIKMELLAHNILLLTILATIISIYLGFTYAWG